MFHSWAPRFLLMWCNLLLFCFDLYLLWFAAVNFVSFSQLFPFLCKDLRHPACLFVLNMVRRYPIEHSDIISWNNTFPHTFYRTKIEKFFKIFRTDAALLLVFICCRNVVANITV